MTFVITQGCCNDGSCISVCPVQCIRPRPGDVDFTTAEQLYIDPVSCIDCGACLDECPVEAVHADYELPDEMSEYLQINADYFTDHPIEDITDLPVIRRELPSDQPELHVAIVGAGPAACYAADVLSRIKGVKVSIFEELPTPYGLVRAGVAPDHPKTKLIGEQFRAVLSRPQVSCFFNVRVGRDVSLDELFEHHHAVIWAAGATGDQPLDIPGVGLPGSHSAREFVAWYNGHPEHTETVFDLSGRQAIVIGNGNVALDVARALAQHSTAFAFSDMADHALQAFEDSGIDHVVVAARRGPAHAAYTTSELLALTQLEGVTVTAEIDEVAVAANVLNALAPEGVDPLLRRRLDKVVALASNEGSTTNRTISLRYLMSPVSINGTERVESVTFERNELAVVDGTVVVRPTGDFEVVEADLVLRAIGYRGQASVSMPFDEATGTIPNTFGRVRDASGLYCAGWIKRGATGVIGTNKTCSIETVDALLSDLEDGLLKTPTRTAEQLWELVHARQPDVLDNAGWLRINAAEKLAGKENKRPRVKFVSVDDLLRASVAVV